MNYLVLKEAPHNSPVYLYSAPLSPCLPLCLSTTWPTSTLASSCDVVRLLIQASHRFSSKYRHTLEPAVWKWAWCVQMQIRSSQSRKGLKAERHDRKELQNKDQLVGEVELFTFNAQVIVWFWWKNFSTSEFGLSHLAVRHISWAQRETDGG